MDCACVLKLCKGFDVFVLLVWMRHRPINDLACPCEMWITYFHSLLNIFLKSLDILSPTGGVRATRCMTSMVQAAPELKLSMYVLVKQERVACFNSYSCDMTTIRNQELLS